MTDDANADPVLDEISQLCGTLSEADRAMVRDFAKGLPTLPEAVKAGIVAMVKATA